VGVLVLTTSPSHPGHQQLLLLLQVIRAAWEVAEVVVAALLPAGVTEPHLLLPVPCVSCSRQRPQGSSCAGICEHGVSDRSQGWMWQDD
jgi:hypothetical protein